MTPWKKICCPVDFSPVSRTALETAAGLARGGAAAITLLHVDEQAPEPWADATLASAEALRMRALERDRQLEAWRDAAARASGAAVECAVASGDPAAEIVAHVEAGGHDVIVMGTHGRTPKEKGPIGSVAQKVVFDAPCPVLVVNARASRAR